MELGWYNTVNMCRDSAVGIATRNGLDGPGIESQWGARFCAPVRTAPGPQSTSYTMCTGSFSGVKRPGRGVDHPQPSSAKVKERVELYLSSPSEPSWPVNRANCTFTFTIQLTYHRKKHTQRITFNYYASAHTQQTMEWGIGS